MSDSGNFKIRYSTKFEATYCRLLRKHYRKDTAALKEFTNRVETMVEDIASNPYLRGSIKEPWPGNFRQQKCDLCKLKFSMPSLKGASQLGRLLYLANQERKEVCFLWIYTHQEFAKQPPTKDLGKAVREVVRHLSD